MRKAILFMFIFLVVPILGTYCQDNMDQLLKKFKSSDWKEVKLAKKQLESIQKEVIPELISMLKDNLEVKLENTGPLIYPGATRFYGHGQILDYDIDYLAIRAGWLLEELTFNNFGFSGIHLPQDMMITHLKLTFPDYYNNSSNRKEIEKSSAEDLRQLALKLSIKKASKWWESSGDNWTRLQALTDALTSYDEKRQVMALYYIRNGETKCNGLTKDYYIEEISKEIVRMSASDVQRISENAKLILHDNKFEWLDNKN